MAKSVKIRRGKTIEHINALNNTGFTGEVGEITVDTDLNTIRVHDGVTLGGHSLANTLNPIFTGIVNSQEFRFKNSYATLGAFPAAATSNQGMVAYNQADGKEYYSNGTAWTPLVQTADLNGFVSSGINFVGQNGDANIFADKTGSQLRFKKIRPGNNITVSTGDADVVQINAANYVGANTNVGSPIFKNVTGTTFNFRGIQAGDGITVAVSGTDNSVIVTSNLLQAFNTVNVNNTTNIPTTTANDTIRFLNGVGVSFVGNANGKSVTANLALAAVNNTLQTGSNVLGTYSNATLTFNKIQAGSGIVLSSGSNGEIVVSAPQVGTVTGAANLNPPSPTSLGLYKQDDAGVLKFYNISAGSNVSISYIDGNNLQISAATGGSAGVGTVQSGTATYLAYYPSTGTAVGPIAGGGAYWDSATSKIVANITGTVSSISNHTTTGLAEGTNLYYTSQRFDDALATKTTSDLAEGTNLYFTVDRAQDAVSDMLLAGNANLVNVSYTTTAASTSTATITVSNTAGLVNGYVVTGSTVPLGITHTIQTVGVGTFTVSPAVYAVIGTAFTITNPADGSTIRLNATAASTSTATVTITDNTGITAGQFMTGTGVSGTSTVQSTSGSTQVVLTPGYNVRVTSGTSLTFSTLTATGLTSTYSDSTDTYTFSVDNNYIGQRARTAISVQAGQGLTYDSVSGQLSLSGAVTQVNGQTGTVILAVGDITGAAPAASPTFTGTPRTVNITAGDDNFKIANKKYVDDNILAVRGATPSAGLTTVQALGAAINGDTLFYQTVSSSIDLKLSRSGGTVTGLLLLNHVVGDLDDDKTAATKRYVDIKATVQTVNSKSGNVLLNADDIAERVSPAPVNVYFTQARARASISAVADGSISDIISYDDTTGVIKFNGAQVRSTVSVQQDNSILTLLSYASNDGVVRFNPNTDVLTEGTNNLFYTTTRARGVISVVSNGSQANFLAYSSANGQISYNASSDKVSEGTNNLYFTSVRARAAISLATSGSQTQLLSYNSANGQFGVNATTTYIAEGTNQYYTDSKARSAISVTVTNSNNIDEQNILTYSNVSGILQFNANTNSIYEGTDNLYFTDARARLAVALTTTDSTVLSYDNVTGSFTFTKPNTDKIAEGSTNKYATTTTVRPMVSAVVTTTAGIATGNHMTYSSSTGEFTINANSDSLTEGNTNIFFTNTRARNAITFSTTTVNSSGTALLAYTPSTGALVFNNSTDSLTEGTTNKWASDATVRSKLSVTGGNGGVMTYNSTTGVFSPTITVNTTNLVYTPSADGTTAKTLDTVQNISEASSPKFNKLNYVSANLPAAPLTLNNPGNVGVVLVNLNNGYFHEFNRDRNITGITFLNPPASGTYVEVVVSLCNVSGGGWQFNPVSSVKWQNGAYPNLLSTTTAATARDIFKFATYDGGTTWLEISRSINVV